jgi:tripartite-type tricarboxylate transporter receptor subunit TctC
MEEKFMRGKRTWTRLALAVAFAMTASAALAADADDYPKRPIKLILPNAPGSSSDVLARILANKLSETIGQQVVVDNRAGAGGLVGMDVAKNAAPDGYTIVAATSAGTSIAASLHKDLTYDPLKDFQYVATYAVVPNMLVVTPSLPIKSLRELIDYCKARNGEVFMASAGQGSQSHLAGVMLLMMGDFKSVHVPYKGGGASVVGVIGGEAQWTITPASSVVGQVSSGNLRAIAQSLPSRTSLLPDVPAVSETVAGYSYSGWNGILMPKDTPPAVVEKFRAALVKTVNSPDVKQAFAKQGAGVVTTSGEDFRKFVQAEIESTGKLVKQTDLKIE